MAVVQVVGSSKTKDPLLAACILNIWLIAASFDIQIDIKYIPGKKNAIADLLSRLHSTSKVDLQLLSILQQHYIWDKIDVKKFKLDLYIWFQVHPRPQLWFWIQHGAEFNHQWDRQQVELTLPTLGPFCPISFLCNYLWNFHYITLSLFFQFLHQSSLSPKVISNYLSSIRSMAKFYNIEHSDLSHIAASRFVRRVTINSRFSPTPERGFWYLHPIQTFLGLWHSIWSNFISSYFFHCIFCIFENVQCGFP